MIGGYVAGYFTQRGMNFYVALLFARRWCRGILGALPEMTIYRPLYRKGELAQVLLTIGLVFVATAAITEFFGAFPCAVQFSTCSTRPVDIGFRTYPAYRCSRFVVGAIIAAVLFDRDRGLGVWRAAAGGG